MPAPTRVLITVRRAPPERVLITVQRLRARRRLRLATPLDDGVLRLAIPPPLIAKAMTIIDDVIRLRGALLAHPKFQALLTRAHEFRPAIADGLVDGQPAEAYRLNVPEGVLERGVWTETDERYGYGYPAPTELDPIGSGVVHGSRAEMLRALDYHGRLELLTAQLQPFTLWDAADLGLIIRRWTDPDSISYRARKLGLQGMAPATIAYVPEPDEPGSRTPRSMGTDPQTEGFVDLELQLLTEYVVAITCDGDEPSRARDDAVAEVFGFDTDGDGDEFTRHIQALQKTAYRWCKRLESLAPESRSPARVWDRRRVGPQPLARVEARD